MTFAAIDWLSISINLLLVIFVIVCLLMTLLILMQRPKQEGLGAAFGGGVTDQVFGARTTNVLQRGTVYLGSLFFLLALLLAILISHQNKKSGLIDDSKPAKQQADAGSPADIEPKPDTAPTSLSDELPASLSDELPADDASPAVEPKPEDADLPADPVDSAEAPAPAGDSPDKPGQP